MSPKCKNVFLSILIFAIVFVTYAMAIRGHWFAIDDLGEILNGRINSWKDFIRVFTSDMRFFSKAYNYNFPQPNFISGFMRPMQHIFLTVIYNLFGTNPDAFGLLHVLFHSLNATIIFTLFRKWLPLSLSCFGSLLFAFYPDTTWLTWLCTLQSSLMLFFLLLSIVTFLPLIKKTSNLLSYPRFYIAGFFFLCSLLSRENPVFFAVWPFCFFILFSKSKYGFASKIVSAFQRSSIFFITLATYVALRIYAFGFESIGRTFNNLFFRFLFLKKIFSTPGSTKLLSQIDSAKNLITSTAEKTTTITAVATAKLQPSNILNKITYTFFEWSRRIFNLPHQEINQKLVLIVLSLLTILFLIYAYNKRHRLLFFLFSGILLLIWPCILVYPDVRYMNVAYPLFIFMVLIGIENIRRKPKLITKIYVSIVVIVLTLLLANGFHGNIIGQAITHKSVIEKSLHYVFLKGNPNLPNNPSLIFVSALGESDIQETLQVISGNQNLKAAYVIIARLYGQSGYDTENVRYNIIPIQNGFRFTSLEKHKCGWNFRSYQPVRWSEKERAYILHSNFFEPNMWHQFSMGKFIIHEIVRDSKNLEVVTDFSMVFDKKWITPNSVFVVWNTENNKYKIIDSTHITGSL
jgi:hypothetical protein